LETGSQLTSLRDHEYSSLVKKKDSLLHCLPDVKEQLKNKKNFLSFKEI